MKPLDVGAMVQAHFWLECVRVVAAQPMGSWLEVEVTLDARCAPGSIKASTLEQKVNETLRQIGVEVLEERTE